MSTQQPFRNKHTAAAFGLLGMAAVIGLASPVQAQTTKPAATTEFKTEQQPLSTETLRIIPVESAASSAGKYEACRICGIVESISLTQYENMLDDSAEPEEMADEVSGKSAQKSRRNLLLAIKGRNSGTQPGRIPDKSTRPALTYYVKVRMEDGTFRIVTQPTQPAFAVGDRVRVTSGAVITA